MSRDKLPWFPFYGTDFFGDEKVRMMSNAQIGLYVKLLWHQWTEGSIPTGYASLQLHAASEEADLNKVVSSCFLPHTTLQDRLINSRLEQIQQKTLKEINAKRKGGRAGGIAKAKLMAQLIAQSKLSSSSQSQNLKTPLLSSGSQKNLSRVIPPSALAKTSRKRSVFPPDFQPNPKHEEIATALGLNVAVQLVKFRDHHLAKGSLMLDWNAAFRTWLRNADEFRRPQ